DLIQFPAIAKSIELESGGNVVINRHGGKGIGLLKDHSNPAPDARGRSSVVDVEITYPYPAGGPRIRNGFMHTVQAAHESGFVASGRSDDRGGVICRHRDGDVVKRLGFAEPGVQLFHVNANAHRQFAPFIMPRLVTRRTALTATTIRMMRIRAPAQACRCHSSKGDIA